MIKWIKNLFKKEEQTPSGIMETKASVPIEEKKTSALFAVNKKSLIIKNMRKDILKYGRVRAVHNYRKEVDCTLKEANAISKREWNYLVDKGKIKGKKYHRKTFEKYLDM